MDGTTNTWVDPRSCKEDGQEQRRTRWGGNQSNTGCTTREGCRPPLDTSVHPKYQTSNASIGGKKEASVPIPSKQERNPTGSMDKDEDRIMHVQGRSSPDSRGRALQEPTPGSNGSRPLADKRPARRPWIPLHGAGPLVYKQRQ